MRWFSTSSGQASPSRPAVPALAAYRQKTESIRAALIAALNGSTTTGARTLVARIQFAGDAENLWYLRPEAMSVLASLHGEAQARDALARISTLFQDVLPEGLASQLRAAGAANSPAFSRRRETLKETA
jgi:hypothetical protein